jgi:V8-like Glu-specific endopeptidase
MMRCSISAVLSGTVAISVVAGMGQLEAIALSASEVGQVAKGVTVLINSQSPGSGVLVSKQGSTYTVLTAAHVVEYTDYDYSVQTPDGQVHSVNYKTVKKLPGLDLAIVQFTSDRTYPVASLANSDTAMEGVSVHIAGFPEPGTATQKRIFQFTSGEISSRPPEGQNGYLMHYTNITRVGMSGGPILNSEGQLVGIHGLANTDPESGSKTGINLGIPINSFISNAPKVGFNPQGISPTPPIKIPTATAAPTATAIPEIATINPVLPIYNSSEGGFSIAMPGQPKLESRPVPLLNGQSAPLKLASVDKGNLAYFAGHIDYPAGLINPDSNPQEVLSNAIQGATQQLGGGTGLTQRETSVNGIPCRAFSTSGTIDNQAVRMEGVFCFENNRLYEVLILGQQNNEFPGLAKQFLSSFKILSPAPKASIASTSYSPSPEVATSNPVIQIYNSPEGGFSIAMPGQPQLQNRPISFPDGQSSTLKIAQIYFGNVVYAAGHIDYPAGVINPYTDPQELLTNSIGGAVETLGGKAGLQQTATTVNGIPCRAFTTMGKVENQDAMVEGIFCYENNRLYEVFMLGEPSTEFPRKAEQFISSFRIKK